MRRVLILDADNATGDMKITETWGLALKRTQTYMSSGFCLAESSPAEDYDDAQWTPSHPHEAPPAEGIASLYNMGDRRMYYWPVQSAGSRSAQRQVSVCSCCQDLTSSWSACAAAKILAPSQCGTTALVPALRSAD